MNLGKSVIVEAGAGAALAWADRLDQTGVSRLACEGAGRQAVLAALRSCTAWLKEQEDQARREMEHTAGEGYTFYEGRADALSEVYELLT